MTTLGDYMTYGRFALGLRNYLRHTIRLEEAQAIVLKRMQERETNFLRLVERGIFGYPQSPYLPLLRLAHCELGDIQKMVRTKGLENTLLALRQAGVYITFEEFKGREPIVRHGQTIRAHPQGFDNPHLGPYYYQAKSGGSTGAGTRVQIDLDHQAAQAPHLMLAREAHGVLDVPTALWYGILPDDTGVGVLLRQARFGHLAEKWFSPIVATEINSSLRNRFATHAFVTLSRLLGAPFPHPRPLSFDRAAVLAQWASQRLKTHGKCLIRCHVSPALRVCLAARELGLDLTGATFMGGGEPPTPAKIREIRSTGARWVPTYFFTEHGAVGLGCARPADDNDLHFLKDALAVIQYARRVPSSELTVEAFHYTSLLPTAPKVLLNVETDDYGVIEHRSCGCPLAALGFTEHLRHVRSFRKLTGEGVTLVGSDMLNILEEVLPARFGGSPLDYQLLEEEDEKGFTRLSLIVSPRVKIEDESTLIQVVLDALGRASVAGQIARTIWKKSGALRVKRMEPICTERGKLMPLYVARRSKLPSGS
jgi:hypothetical protein